MVISFIATYSFPDKPLAALQFQLGNIKCDIYDEQDNQLPAINWTTRLPMVWKILDLDIWNLEVLAVKQNPVFLRYVTIFSLFSHLSVNAASPETFSSEIFQPNL